MWAYSRSVALSQAAPIARSRRDEILDAAEALFSRRGYYGVSIRQIADLAGVEFSLARYYFGSKDDLFTQVALRRVDELYGAMGDELAALEAAGGAPSVEAVVRALVYPPVERAFNGGEGWRNYLQLIGQLNSIADRPELAAPMRERYGPVYFRALALLGRNFPAVQRQVLFWPFYFIHLIMSGLFNDLYAPEFATGGVPGLADYEATLERVVKFTTGGVVGLMGEATPPTN